MQSLRLTLTQQWVLFYLSFPSFVVQHYMLPTPFFIKIAVIFILKMRGTNGERGEGEVEVGGECFLPYMPYS